MIYVFAPAYQVSGGPEALQQMCYYLRKIGRDAVMVFYNYENGRNPMPERYLIYGNPWILVHEVEDKKENSVVVPERRPFYLNPYKKAKRYIWWLSKDNLIYEKAPLLKRIKYAVKKLLHIEVISLDVRYCNFDLEEITHLCGSKYAYEYVRNELGIKDVHYCVEPISLQFLNIGPCNDTDGRKDVVLYNPSKPSSIMDELLKRGNFNYVSLSGYAPEELAELYKSSKLYVDFGDFPGPERMPKEAVYFGCNILVGKRNAAENDFDVAIPEKFKMCVGTDIGEIERMITELLNNPLVCFCDFQCKVVELETKFTTYLDKLFLKA